MPTQVLKIHPNEPERLRLAWHRSWRKITVYWDSDPIATFCQANPIKDWQSVLLPTGDVLKVCFKDSLGRSTLEATYNDQILTRIDVHHPDQVLDRAFLYMQVVAGIHFLAVFYILRGAILNRGVWIWGLLLGSVYLGLSLLKERRARLALTIASVLYMFEGSYLIYSLYNVSVSGFISLLTLLYFVLALYKAILGLQVLTSLECRVEHRSVP